MTILTIPQLVEIKAKHDFAFKVGGKGRAIVVRRGQIFWVTNTRHDQTLRGIVLVDRKGKGHISGGYAFSHNQLMELFEPLENEKWVS